MIVSVRCPATAPVCSRLRSAAVRSERESLPTTRKVRPGVSAAPPEASASTRCRLDQAVANSSSGYATTTSSSGTAIHHQRIRTRRPGDARPAGLLRRSPPGGAGREIRASRRLAVRAPRMPLGRAAPPAARRTPASGRAAPSAAAAGGTAAAARGRPCPRRARRRDPGRRPGSLLARAVSLRLARRSRAAPPQARFTDRPRRGASMAGQVSMTTSSPAAFARAAAASSITPSCSQTALAPTAIASSTTAPAEITADEARRRRRSCPGTSAASGSPGSPCTVSALGCTGTIVMPRPCRYEAMP